MTNKPNQFVITVERMHHGEYVRSGVMTLPTQEHFDSNWAHISKMEGAVVEEGVITNFFDGLRYTASSHYCPEYAAMMAARPDRLRERIADYRARGMDRFAERLEKELADVLAEVEAA